MGYFKTTIKGVAWMGALRSLTRVIAFVKIVVLARMLSPLQFGLFGIASLVLAFLEILTETGINAFLIQEDSKIEEYLNSAWVVSIFRGLLISFSVLVLSIPIALFFNTPEATRLLILMSSAPLLRGFINPTVIRFQKDLQFKKEFYFRLCIFSFDAVITILLVFSTRSAESLVWGMVGSTLFELILSWLVIRPFPKIEFEKDRVRKVFNRGKWLTLAGTFEYFFQHGDDIVVGKLLNTTSLGIYQIAYKVSTLPITEGGEIISKVVFPVYVKISEDKKILKKAYLKVLGAISVIIVPFGLLLFLFAEPFVTIFLGSQWLDAIPVLRVLAVFGVIRAISGSSSALFLALKKQKYITLVTFVSILGLAITILPLVNAYGIVGAALSTIIGSVAAIPVMYHFLRKELYAKG